MPQGATCQPPATFSLCPSSRDGSWEPAWHRQPPCPLGAQPTSLASANCKKQHVAGSLPVDPTGSPDLQPNRGGCMLSGWDRRGVVRKWFISLHLNEESHQGLPVTQSMAGVLLSASGPFFSLSSLTMCASGLVAFLSPLCGLPKPREEIEPENHLRKSPGSNGWILHGWDWRQKTPDEVHA